MSKLIAYLLIFVIAIALQFLVMIYGWGVSPKSWGWLVWGGIVAPICLQGLLEAVKNSDD